MAREESMTIIHLESTKLPCHGCFATLSMTFTAAFCLETIFEIGSNIIDGNSICQILKENSQSNEALISTGRASTHRTPIILIPMLNQKASKRESSDGRPMWNPYFPSCV